MFDVFKESVFAGIAAASLTREKIAELAAEVSRRAKLTQQEANEFQSELGRRLFPRSVEDCRSAAWPLTVLLLWASGPWSQPVYRPAASRACWGRRLSSSLPVERL
jgi:hypothetical protein